MAALTPNNLIEKFNSAREYQYKKATNFYEFQRHALGYPADFRRRGIPPISEGSTSSIIREFPKRILPDKPIYKLDMDDKVHQCVIEYLFNEKFLPEANTHDGFHAKCQLALRNALTFGLQIAEVFTKVNDKGEVVPDFRLPFTGYVIVEKEAYTAFDANYYFIVQWYSPDDIKDLINQEQIRKKKGETEIYKIAKLNALLEHKTAKDTSESSYVETRQQYDYSNEYVKIVKAVCKADRRKNKKTRIYYFNPHIDIGIIGKEELADYYGYMPISPLYYEVVPYQPYGQGIAEILNGDQNIMDHQKGLITKAEELGLAPMMVSKGISNKSIRLEALHIISAPADLDGVGFDIVNYETNSMARYPDRTTYNRNLMYNKVGSQDSAGVVETGTPTGSKTPAGVQAQQGRLGINDEAVRKRTESWLDNIFTLMTYAVIYNRENVEEVEIDQMTWNRVVEYIGQDRDKDVRLSKDGRKVIKIDWSKIKQDMVRGARMEVSFDWNINRETQINQLVELFGAWKEDPKLFAYLRARPIMGKAVANIGLNPEEVLLSEEEAPVTRNFTEDDIRALAREEAQQEHQQSQLRPSDMNTAAVKEMIKNKGFNADGSLPRDDEMELKDKELELEDKKIDNEHEQKMRELDIKEQQVQAQTQQPTEGEKGKTAPQEEQPVNPQTALADDLTSFIQQLEAANATKEDIAQATLLIKSVDPARPGVTKEQVADVETQLKELLNEVRSR